MSLYDQIRHFADSHGLVIIFGLFLLLCLWPFRPGAARRNEAAAQSIFAEDHDGE